MLSLPVPYLKFIPPSLVGMYIVLCYFSLLICHVVAQRVYRICYVRAPVYGLLDCTLLSGNTAAVNREAKTDVTFCFLIHTSELMCTLVHVDTVYLSYLALFYFVFDQIFLGLETSAPSTYLNQLYL